MFSREDMVSTGGSDTESYAETAPVILVVDDDGDTRAALRDLLESEGYAVAEAANGQQALAYLEQQTQPTAIVLDLAMPVMDGWQFAEQVQSTPAFARIPILVVTAREAHWGYPSRWVFRKPLVPARLLDTLSRVRRLKAETRRPPT
jgi:PleD family two-component response regulator